MLSDIKISKSLANVSDEQKDELRELLSQGQSISDTGNVWTLQRIVDLIQLKFGIKY